MPKPTDAPNYAWLAARAPSAPALADDWRSWIAENLILGAAPEDLAVQLQQHLDISPELAAREVQAAQHSPYLQGARRLRNRLQKRDWTLDIASQLGKLLPASLPRRHRLDTATFLREHYAANRPVIVTGMLDDCAARSKWTLNWLAGRFADRSVEVQFGRNGDADYEINSTAHKREMRFGEYIQLLQSHGRTNDFYMTANNHSRNRAALAELWDDVPRLPEYLAPMTEADGFLWIGPAGTITPFHHDLTNNFMMQLVGRKQVKLIAPWDTPRLRNHRHCFTPVDGRDLNRHPELHDVTVLDCVLEPGEILFLPVGWWHFVEALDLSITVSATHFHWNNHFVDSYPTDREF